MIIDLPSTTTSAVNKKLVELRERGGAVALGRVLTMVIVTDDGVDTESAIDAANDASREHPCRVIVLARGAKRAAARLDAQIRVGGDAGASEVIVLRLYGPLAEEGASATVPLLLPDAPVVAWWPREAPDVPAEDPIGRLATRRITDAAASRNPQRMLAHRRDSYADGDTDLAWTRVTLWRGLLAAALDQPPHEEVTRAVVSGAADSPSTDLLAGWLAARLRVPVIRAKADVPGGLESVRLERRSGDVTLSRPDGKVGTLLQPGQPQRRVALQRRPLRDCLSEELRRLDPDEIYEAALRALPDVRRGRAPAVRDDAPRTAAKARAVAHDHGGPDAAAAARRSRTRSADQVAAGSKAGSSGETRTTKGAS
ncbi:MAG TPA: glucose-6-phosphate dehydrogenase assembly protein OpcA [Pseudonocardiaceae bacterium]